MEKDAHYYRNNELTVDHVEVTVQEEVDALLRHEAAHDQAHRQETNIALAGVKASAQEPR